MPGFEDMKKIKLNIFQKLLIAESALVISAFLYTEQPIHAAIHLGFTIYVVYKLKDIKTGFTKEE